MSYKNQRILTISNPVGLEKAIASLQEDLLAIDYLEKIFGRARMQKVNHKSGQVATVPVAYQGGKEYTSVLPNDNIAAQCFFLATGDASPLEYFSNQSNRYSREVHLIFWGNLKKINPAKDYIFTDEIIADFLKVLSANKYVVEVNGFTDGTFEEVYEETIIPDKYYEGKSQPLMFPYTGVRIALNIAYEDGTACGYIPANEN